MEYLYCWSYANANFTQVFPFSSMFFSASRDPNVLICRSYVRGEDADFSFDLVSTLWMRWFQCGDYSTPASAMPAGVPGVLLQGFYMDWPL